MKNKAMVSFTVTMSEYALERGEYYQEAMELIADKIAEKVFPRITWSSKPSDATPRQLMGYVYVFGPDDLKEFVAELMESVKKGTPMLFE